MTEKITIDVPNRLIIINAGITSLDVKVDIYSGAKRLWKEDPNLNKLKFPFRVLGGDPLGGELSAGAYFFLQNQSGYNWRIRPYEGDHELTITGNLYAEDSSLPIFISTIGDYTVQIRLETSSLTQVITSSGLAESDKEDIANLVWTVTTGLNVNERIALIKKIETNRWKIDNDQLIIYDDNGTTPLKTFNLSGEQKKAYSEKVPT